MNLLAGRLQVPAHWRWTTLINGAHSDSTHKPNGVGTCRSTCWQVGNVRCLFLDFTNFVNEQSVFALICTLVPMVYSSDREKYQSITSFFYFIWLLVCLFFPLMAVKKFQTRKITERKIETALKISLFLHWYMNCKNRVGTYPGYSCFR